MLTRDRPKPLIEVAGRPLIDHALALVRAAGIRRIVVNTHAHAAQLAAHLARVAPEALVSHEPERLETGGGLKRALPLLGAGPVVTLNADMVWSGPNPLATLARRLDPARAPGSASSRATAATGHTGPGDFFRAADGRLARRGAAPVADFVYAGAQIIDTAARRRLPRRASFRSTRSGTRSPPEGSSAEPSIAGGWVDVGRPEGIALAETALA